MEKDTQNYTEMYSNKHIQSKYREYIRKYVGLLGGTIPDTSTDTNLFIQGLEKERVDISMMLDICSSSDIEPLISNIFIEVFEEGEDENRILIRFRHKLIQWIKMRINSELEGGE